MVKAIQYTNGEYILGVPTEIVDEGAYYESIIRIFLKSIDFSQLRS